MLLIIQKENIFTDCGCVIINSILQKLSFLYPFVNKWFLSIFLTLAEFWVMIEWKCSEKELLHS